MVVAIIDIAVGPGGGFGGPVGGFFSFCSSSGLPPLLLLLKPPPGAPKPPPGAPKPKNKTKNKRKNKKSLFSSDPAGDKGSHRQEIDPLDLPHLPVPLPDLLSRQGSRF